MVLLVFWKSRRAQVGFKGSKVGFQGLTDKSEMFCGSEDEDEKFENK